jgi:hypothetical protein
MLKMRELAHELCSTRAREETEKKEGAPARIAPKKDIISHLCAYQRVF